MTTLFFHYIKQQQYARDKLELKLYQIYNTYINFLKYASLPLCP